MQVEGPLKKQFGILTHPRLRASGCIGFPYLEQSEYRLAWAGEPDRMGELRMNVHEAIKNRRSVREYSPRPIPPASVARLRDALRLAPSACNLQPWRFVLVSDPQLRGQIAQVANEQQFIAQAPLLVVACGFPDQAYQHMGGHGNSVDIDVAIALDHLTLAAVAEGLGTCWIGAFNEGKVKALLRIPKEAKIVAMMPIGFPLSDRLIHPLASDARKDEVSLFDQDHFSQQP
jgi:nitroreductase